MLELIAAWTRHTQEERAMHAARNLAERVICQPGRVSQTRAGRIAAATDFITNYQAIWESWQQVEMDAALAAITSAYPELSVPALAQLADAPQSASISVFPAAELPDLLAINRLFTGPLVPGRSSRPRRILPW